MSGFEGAQCPVCGAADAHKRYQIHYDSDRALELLDLQEEKPDVWLMRCGTCGHDYASPRLASETLTTYYSQINSEYYETSEQSDHNELQHIRVRQLVEERMPGGRVLDIGCGNGFLLNQFDPSRWTRRGIEPSPRASSHARDVLGLDVVNAFADESNCPAASCDVALMFDVIEHLADPMPLLELMVAAVRPGGLVLVGTGNVASLNARLWRGRWLYYGSWEHISFFSPSSLRGALARAGMLDVEIVRVPATGAFAHNAAALGRNALRYVRNTGRVAAGRAGMTSVREPSHYELAFDHMIAIGTKGGAL